MIKIGDVSNLQQKSQSAAARHKQTECNVCLCKMRSDTLKRHMMKHRELHTLDEEEIRNEIKRREKLRETREEREQLVRQIAEKEGLPNKYCDIEISDTEEDSLPVQEELLKDDQTYTRKIECGRTICKMLEQGCVREDSLEEQQGSAQNLQKEYDNA